MSNNPKPPPGGWNKGRTFAAQSEAAKRLFKAKAFEATLQSLKFAFLSGRTTTLHAICATLGLVLPDGQKDCVITKEELNELILTRRTQLANESTAQIPVVTPVVTLPEAPVPQEIPRVVEPVRDAPAPAEAEEPVSDFHLPELTDNPKVRPFGFQVRKATELITNITVRKHRAALLLSQTGSGKTFMLGAMIKALYRIGFFKDFCGMWPVMYVTKASIVDQTEKVMSKCFGLTGHEVYVTNIEQLRSQMGKLFIHEETVVVQGQEHIIFKWRPRSLPRLVIWDESQILKNIDSTQSKIAQALNDINEVTHGQEASKVVQIFSSATPFMRLCETKCFAVATRATIFDV